MSCKDYLKAHDYMSEDQKDVIGELYMSGINRDGHTWVAFGDVEGAVAKLVVKQIPMKPKKIAYQYSICDSCGLAFDDVVLGFKALYCPHCGQAIDWSEEE